MVRCRVPFSIISGTPFHHFGYLFRDFYQKWPKGSRAPPQSVKKARKLTPRVPKWSPRVPKWSENAPKGDQMEPKGAHMESKGAQMEPRGPPKCKKDTKSYRKVPLRRQSVAQSCRNTKITNPPNKQTETLLNKQPNKYTNTQTHKQTNKQTNKQTDRQTDRQTNKQTNKHTRVKAS